MILHKSLIDHVEGCCSVIGATHQYQCEYEVLVTASYPVIMGSYATRSVRGSGKLCKYL